MIVHVHSLGDYRIAARRMGHCKLDWAGKLCGRIAVKRVKQPPCMTHCATAKATPRSLADSWRSTVLAIWHWRSIQRLSKVVGSNAVASIHWRQQQPQTTEAHCCTELLEDTFPCTQPTQTPDSTVQASKALVPRTGLHLQIDHTSAGAMLTCALRDGSTRKPHRG